MRTAGIGYASYFFTLQRIRKKLPVAGSVDFMKYDLELQSL